MVIRVVDPWQVTASAYPIRGTPDERLRFLLSYAILAPSGHNTQPWEFRIGDGVLQVRADRSRALPVVDPDDRELTISCGAALFILRIAMRRFGHAGTVAVLPDPADEDLLALVELGAPVEATAEDHALFGAIWRRRTNRRPFDGRPLPESLVAVLGAAAEQEGARFKAVRRDGSKEELADLISRGDRIQFADARFRRELAAWIHPNRTRSHDGMPGHAFGIGDLASTLGPLAIRTFTTPKGVAARDRDLAMGSPVLAVLGTGEDDARGWMTAGQALSRVLLRARAEGVSASFLNQPVEVPQLRPRVAEAVGWEGHPQVLLRLGHGPEVRPTPRRPVEDVLVET